MKRSGGVTAAAIVLFLGSGLLILIMGLSVLPLELPPLGQSNPAAQLSTVVFGIGLYGLFAAWGIVTAVGILRLRNWARISILVMAGFSASCILFAAAALMVVIPMMPQTPEMRGGVGAVVVSIFAMMLAIPLGISIWWLVFFLRKKVKLQFETAAEGRIPADLAAADGVWASGVSGANPSLPQSEVSFWQRNKIPTSIIVIAVFLLIGPIFIALTVPLAIQSRAPFLLMGALISGKSAVTTIAVMGAIELILGLALLLRQSWSLDATVAFAVLSVVNFILFFVSPSREAYFRILLASYPTPPGAPPDMFPNLMHTILTWSMGLGLGTEFIALYFLWTRRGAYRAACARKA